MGQVSASPMTAAPADVAAAFSAAYEQLRGRLPPSQSSWLYPLAASAVETADWTSLYNNNLGNVTTAGGGDWYANPKVTNGLKFASYASLQDGALAELKVLDRFGGVDAADNGDLQGFQQALNSYLGGGTYPSISGKLQRYASLQPAIGSPLIASLPQIVKPLLVAGSLLVLASLVSEAIRPGSSPLSPKGRRALGFA